ncbi:MAG: hypothetical protein MZV49_04105 [Rhodopseudomonas palustris]|nr:hypothetical protein [Rhodopseudomonas palustris]
MSEHIAQTQEDKHRKREEDDGVNIHVAFTFWSRPALRPVGKSPKKTKFAETEVIFHHVGINRAPPMA